ncbi:MAG: sulfotransferase, partial [Paracoccaceae bacterium]
ELKLKSFVRKPERGRDIEEYLARSRIARVNSPHLSQERYGEIWAAAREQRTLHGLADFIRYDAQAVFASCNNAPASVAMWCAKEVGGPTMRILETWRSIFPGSKALFITRDPLMVTRAILNDRRRKGRRLSLHQIAFQTYDSMRVVTAQSRLLADRDVYLVAYEDLVADTASVMADVAAFLGVSNTPKFTAPTIFSEPVVVRTASRQTTAVFQQSASWKDGLTRRERWTVAAVHAIASWLPGFNVHYPALRRRLRRRKPA